MMKQASQTHFDTTWVRNWIASEISAGRITGCAIEVRWQGQTVFQRNIGRRTPSGDPVTPQTQFWIASMTKPVVSVAALKLIEQGRLSLADPVSKFIAGFGDAGVLTASGGVAPANRAPTVLDLFLHSSGVTYGQFGDGDIHRRYAETGVFDYSSNNTEMAARLAQLPLLHQPGTFFEYGMSTDLLGRVIETVTGQSLETNLRNIVLDPLEMHSTRFTADPERIADLPASDIQRSVAPHFTSSPAWQSGGAGLFSTASDYMRFAKMMHGKGRLADAQIVKPETMQTMLQQHLPSGVGYGDYTPSLGITAPGPENGLGFGLGVAVRTTEVPETPGGTGEFFWPGVSGGNFWVDPANNLIVVFLTHAPLHRTKHRIGLRAAIYAGLDRRCSTESRSATH